MYKIRRLLESDYCQLCDWWKWWRFPAPVKENLPDNGTCGIMVSKGDIDVCAGFIYFTNSKMAWVEYIVSNPKYKDSDRKSIIETLIIEINKIIKSRGYNIVFTSIKNESLKRHFESIGYIKGSDNTTEMVCVL